jgi:hypothetical protein
MPQVARERSGVVATVGELVSASMPQHVRVHGERKLRGLGRCAGPSAGTKRSSLASLARSRTRSFALVGADATRVALDHAADAAPPGRLSPD